MFVVTVYEYTAQATHAADEEPGLRTERAGKQDERLKANS